MRIAAVKEEQQRKAAAASGQLSEQPIEGSWVRRKAVAIYRGVVGLLKRPGYLVPLVINLTGSVWFFLLVRDSPPVRWKLGVDEFIGGKGVIEPYGADHQLAGILIHGFRGVVG